VSDTRQRITVDPPSEMVILAARHLDATEGRVQVGAIVDTSTRSAITTVLRYIAKAHNNPTATPPEDPGDETCPDCHVTPGQPHDDGCDNARCTACGKQRITCTHGASDTGWGQIWNGPEENTVSGGSYTRLADPESRHRALTAYLDKIRGAAVSAPLNLTAEQLRTIGLVLDELSEIRKTRDVDLAPYGRQQLGLGGNVLSFSWDGNAYVIDDRNGE
jgi:hypothetical protein